MKKEAIIVIMLLISAVMYPQGVKFESGTFKEALIKAKQENKIVFIDCYTTWCGPCVRMSKEVFPDQKTGEYFNRNFVNLKIDMEKGEGPEIMKLYNISAFPTMIFIDFEMNLLHKTVGGKTVDELIKEAQNALDPKKRITALDSKYKNGERDLNFLLEYFNALSRSSDKHRIGEVAKIIVDSIPIEKFDNQEMFHVLNKADVEYGSSKFKYILDYEDSLKAKVGSASYFTLLDGIINSYLFKKSQSVENLNELKTEIENCKQTRIVNNQDFMEKGLMYEFHLSHNDFDNWLNLKMEEALKRVEDSSLYISVIHDIAHEVYEDSRFDEAHETINYLAGLAHNIAETKYGSIFGNLSLAKLYVRSKNKDAALQHFNIFFSLNEEANGNNSHHTITKLRDTIDNL